MSKELIECVPNFSEGRDYKIIERIVRAIKDVAGVQLLHIDKGYDVNRTVITFVGNVTGVEKASFRAIAEAAELIDMRKHSGIHPRMGAMDVFPIIPLANITSKKCIQISNDLAGRVGNELQIPVYLYGKSAVKPERRELSYIRQGGYESLEKRITSPQWQPDYGPAKFNARSGAVVIGVRDMLIALNVNLATEDIEIARDIAYQLRERGYPLKKGEQELKPGLFKYCKAIGWYIPEYKRVQVSINLTDYKKTPMQLVMEAARHLALEKNVKVTGSEIIGMVPLDAMISAGLYYLKKRGIKESLPVNAIINEAINGLGLNDLSAFNPDKKILDIKRMT
jgi:glutamate formiminotransferase/formiminotetrahydrofolate cyclodeaminase